MLRTLIETLSLILNGALPVDEAEQELELADQNEVVELDVPEGRRATPRERTIV